MKKWLILICINICLIIDDPGAARAQNMIHDPGLEDSLRGTNKLYLRPGYISFHYGRLFYKDHYKAPTPEIQKIINNDIASVSRSGKGCTMAGMGEGLGDRRCAVMKLNAPLEKGKEYMLEVYIRHAFGSFASNGIGIGFSTHDFSSRSSAELTQQYVITPPGWDCGQVASYPAWQKIVIEYTATGSEKNVLAGAVCFPDHFTRIPVDYTKVKGNFSLYLFDDFLLMRKEDYLVYDYERTLSQKSVFFDRNSYTLNPACFARLDSIAEILLTGNSRIEISGHTDSSGNEMLNKSLSSKRAETVKSYLVGRGVPAARIRTGYYASSVPIKALPKEKAYLNRRVEYQIKNPAE